MRRQLRKSGIDIIGDVPWGTHFFQFYQTKEDLIDILVPYFKAGLENNEFCIWLISQPLDVEEAKEALKKAVPDFDIHLKKGQIEIVPYTHMYANFGSFDSERILYSWIGKLNQALASGYEGLRMSGNVSWLEKTDWNKFIDFEEKADSVIGNYQTIVLCNYPIYRCSATEIIDVVINHQFALIKREGKWEQIESSRRKKAEETAIQAAENWEYTFDAVPDLIAILDTEYRIVRANKALAERLGVTSEECTGLICYRAIHGTDGPPSFCPHRQLLEDGLEHTTEIYEDSIDGDFIVSVSPLHDSVGKLTGCIHIARDITKRKRAGEALRESEERLRFALETSHTGAWDLDLMSRNSPHRSLEHDRIFGYEQLLSQWTYEMFLDHVLPEDRAMVDAKFRKATTTGSDWSFECRIRRVDGKVRWIWAAGRHRIDAGGSACRMAGIVQDITERKKVEKELRESEEKYRNLVETANEGILVIDAGHRIAYVNEKMTEMLGCSRKEMIGKSVGDFTDDEGKVVFEKNMEKRRQGINESHEFRFITKEGFPLWTQVNSKSLFDKDGKFTGSISMLTDITKRKNAETKLKETLDNLENLIKERTVELEKAYKSLKESEERYRIITEQTGQLVYDYNLEADAADWAGNIEELTGYTPDEFRGMSLNFWLSCIHPEDQNRLLEKYEKCMVSGDAYRMEYRFRKKSGEYIYFEDNGIFLRDKKGNSNRVLGAVKDITERKEAEIFVANIETARKKEIHHRIKNNLQVISSLLDLQSEKFRNREYVDDLEVLKAFRESQDRVTSIALIHEELHEGRGTDTLNFSPYLERLVKNLFQTYRVGNTDTSLSIELEEDIFFDMDVAVPLGIIINELVSNSLKYAFPDKDKGLIQIKLCREKSAKYTNNSPECKEEGDRNTNFVLTVSDNGIGIPENFNSENSGSLGLQLVMILVDQLEGELELKRNSGTEFTIGFTVAEKISVPENQCQTD